MVDGEGCAARTKPHGNYRAEHIFDPLGLGLQVAVFETSFSSSVKSEDRDYDQEACLQKDGDNHGKAHAKQLQVEFAEAKSQHNDEPRDHVAEEGDEAGPEDPLEPQSHIVSINIV